MKMRHFVFFCLFGILFSPPAPAMPPPDAFTMLKEADLLSKRGVEYAPKPDEDSIKQAVSFYQKAYIMGEGDAAIGLAELIQKGWAAPEGSDRQILVKNGMQQLQKQMAAGNSNAETIYITHKIHGIDGLLKPDPDEVIHTLKNTDNAGLLAIYGKQAVLGGLQAILPKEGLEMLLKGAAQNHTRSQREVGLTYLGAYILPPEPEKAIPFLAKAADAGDEVAAFHLGMVYKAGFGTEKDAAKAQHYLQRAAETQHEAANFWLNPPPAFARAQRLLVEKGKIAQAADD